MGNLPVGKTWWGGNVLLVLVFFATGCFSFEILAIGDNITQGLQKNSSGYTYGILSPVNGAANVGGYEPILKNLLDNMLEPSNVYNWCAAGETSVGCVNRIDGVLNSQNADYALLLYGANDLPNGVSSSVTKENLRSMIAKCRVKNITPIISELSPFNSFTSRIVYEYNRKITALGSEKGFVFASVYQDMIAGWNSVPYHS